MAGKTNIEWATDSWNPVVGCSVISPGCRHCYAMRMAARIEAAANAGGGRIAQGGHYVGTTRSVGTRNRKKKIPVWTGALASAPDHVWEKPLRWKRSRKIFVNSMSDLFHEAVPDEWIDRAFGVMAACPQHTFQVLTKRAGRMWRYMDGLRCDDRFMPNRITDAALSFFTSVGDIRSISWDLPKWPLSNVWLGVSTERQQEAYERIPYLVHTTAAVRFISAEPLLGQIDLERAGAVTRRTPGMELAGFIDWVILGGESGPRARRMDPEWARSIRDQCSAAGISFFMKQMDKKLPIPDDLMVREYPASKGEQHGTSSEKARRAI